MGFHNLLLNLIQEIKFIMDLFSNRFIDTCINSSIIPGQPRDELKREEEEDILEAYL